jgi:hypothetical protein
MNQDALDRELKLYGDLLIREYRRKLKEDKTIASGDLSNSFVFDIEQLNNSIALVISGYSYGRVIDEGRGVGKKLPPLSAIARWIMSKDNFRIRDSKGRFKPKTLKDANRIAYKVADGISKNGSLKRFNKKGTNFLTLVFERISAQMGQDLALAFGADLQIELEKIIYKKQ